MFDPRLFTDDQLRAFTGHSRAKKIVVADDASYGTKLRAALECSHRRTGTLWEGRYKASLVQDSNYLLTCQRYIELNPVRARMVAAPGEYPYSSYAHHAAGSDDTLITAHLCYLELAVDPSARQQAYRTLFHNVLDEKLLTRIRRSTNACGIIGDS